MTTVEGAVSAADESAWRAHDGLLLLSTLASGVVRLSELGNPGAFTLPYPADAQRALDRLQVVGLLRECGVPASVPELVEWCARRPVRDWPLDLPEDVAAAGDYLVDPQTRVPTQLCYEWAIDVADAAVERYERQLIGQVMDRCRDLGSPSSYVAFRRLLVQRPVLTSADLLTVHGDPDLVPLVDLLRQVYAPAPASYLANDRYVACARCHCLLLPTRTAGWRCEQDRCRFEGPAKLGHEYRSDSRDEVLLLARPLRMFITGPGRAETELEAKLLKLGVLVEMWPNFDAYDLRMTFPRGQVWAVDVKDRANPALLARGAAPLRAVPPYTDGFLVVPRYRLRQREDYLRVFDHHCPAPVAAVLPLVTDTALISRAKAVLAGGKEGDEDAS